MNEHERARRKNTRSGCGDGAADMFVDDENDDTKAESHDEQILLVVEGDEYWDGHECHVECKVA